MDDFFEGQVVIVALTMQAGTVANIVKDFVWILLQNGDIWCGNMRDIRHPQDEEDLKACVVNVDRFLNR